MHNYGSSESLAPAGLNSASRVSLYGHAQVEDTKSNRLPYPFFIHKKRECYFFFFKYQGRRIFFSLQIWDGVSFSQTLREEESVITLYYITLQNNFTKYCVNFLLVIYNDANQFTPIKSLLSLLCKLDSPLVCLFT